jgi:hypothetical protein
MADFSDKPIISFFELLSIIVFYDEESIKAVDWGRSITRCNGLSVFQWDGSRVSLSPGGDRPLTTLEVITPRMVKEVLDWEITKVRPSWFVILR